MTKKHKLSCAAAMWLPLIAGALALVLLFTVVTQRDAQKMRDAADETLSFIRSCCEKYTNYRLGAQTAELESVLDKARGFGRYLSANGATDETTLSRYLKEQELDGLLVLDSTMLPTLSVSLDGTNVYDLWRNVMEDENVSSIRQYSVKSFMQSQSVNGTMYNYAVIARPNNAGLILCYSASKLVQTDEAEFSMNTLLSGYTFRLDGVAVVTDDKSVLCSNEPAMQGRLVAELQQMAQSEDLRDENGLTTIRHVGEKWFGFDSKYKNWNIHIFFPTHGVHAGRSTVMAYGIVLYALFWILYMFLRHRSLQENIRHMEKQYQLTHAISSAYVAGVMIRPADNSWESINMPERLAGLFIGKETAEEMVQTLIEQRIAPSSREAYRRFVDLATLSDRLKNRNSAGCDYENVDGRWYYSLIVPQERDAEGNVTEVILLTRDVTEEKRRELDYQEKLRRTAEQAERANIAKTDFLRRMSHDVRTPINGIRGMVEISRHYQGDEAKQEECRRKIMDASGFLLDLVNDVLDMNKLESGEIKLDSKPFDLRQLLGEVCDLIEQQSAEAGLRFSTEPLSCMHYQLIGSPLHLRQILQNVMTNAVKYNRPNGSIRVTCRETAVKGDKAVYTFTCADTGIGMSPEFQKHIFEPFAQEDNAARTRYKGTGLGMSIVKELVEQMNGKITFTSKQDVGSTFVMSVELQIDHNAAPAPAKSEPENLSIEGVRVLLVEDNELNMEIAQFLLQNNGAKITSAWNGQQAVEAFAASQPGDFDVILMDIMMPVMNGLEAAKTIRAMNRPDAKTIPILAMTANAFADDAERSSQVGINEHLSKPIDADKVIKAIAKYVKKR